MKKRKSLVFWRLCVTLLLCLVFTSMNVLSVSAQIQETRPWGNEEVKDLNPYERNSLVKVSNGWYHYQAAENEWKDLAISKNEAAYEVTVWRKTSAGYEVAGRIEKVEGYVDQLRQIIRWDKGVDYYIWFCTEEGAGAYLSIFEPMDRLDGEDMPSSEVKDISSEGKANVSVTGKNDAQWFKYKVPETGTYKFSFPNEKNAARVIFYHEESYEGRTYLSNYGGRAKDFSRQYKECTKGEEIYIKGTSWQDAVSYELSVKRVEKTLYIKNKEHAETLRENTKLSDIAEGKAQGVVQYLNAIYKDTERGLYIGQEDETDKAVLKKLAQRITENCSTQTQKAEAIARWVKRNIEYDTETSSYASQVFYTRKGDCYGDSMLIATLAKLCGLRSAVVTGWKADLTRYTTEQIRDFAGHAWDYIYVDGQWKMYDCLGDNYNITDSSVITEKGYYSSAVEGIYIIGQGVDPVFASSWTDQYTPVYYQGEFMLLRYGVPAASNESKYYVDDDGQFMEDEDTVVGWTNVTVEDREYSVCPETYDSDVNGELITKTSGYTYTDGSRPKNSRLYTNGWITSGGISEDEQIPSYYAGIDGILYNMTIEKINGKTYYFQDTGSVVKLNMSPEKYSLTAGKLNIHTGVKGQILVDKQIEKYAINKQEGAHIQFRDYDKNLVDIDENGTITTKKEGDVCIWYDVVDDDGRYYSYNGSLSFTISDKAKPTPDYSDRPVNDNKNPGQDDNNDNKEPGNDDNNSNKDPDQDDDNNNKNPSEDNNDKNSDKDDSSNKGNTDSTIKVIKPKIYQLSAQQYVYDGKIKTPAVRICGENGVQIPQSAYKVQKAAGRKNVGKYAYKIIFTGAYNKYGTKTLTFEIIPKSTTITKVGGAKTSCTVNWKKQPAKMAVNRIGGYQIRYSLKKNMQGSKLVNVKGYNKSSTKIKKLKSKKKYYIQLRTYMKVNGKNYYSKWTEKKSVNVK